MDNQRKINMTREEYRNQKKLIDNNLINTNNNVNIQSTTTNTYTNQPPEIKPSNNEVSDSYKELLKTIQFNKNNNEINTTNTPSQYTTNSTSTIPQYNTISTNSTSTIPQYNTISTNINTNIPSPNNTTISTNSNNDMANILDDDKPRKNKKKLNLSLFTVLIVFFSIILIYSGLSIFNWLKDNKNIKKINEEINTKVKTEQIDIEGQLINPPQANKENDYWYYVKLPFYSVDFNELKKKNSDTVAFIHMDQTNINYPVVQTTNNDYYLTRAFDKSKNYAGWVYMDYRNDSINLSDNTVIYGHGRLDKTVFGSLKNALTKQWQENKENYAIWLSTPSKNMLFQIFSIYTINSESYYIKTDFKNSGEKQKWINTMLERNTANIQTEVTTDDKILTLSTCQNNNGGRIVVQAKLIKVQNRTN